MAQEKKSDYSQRLFAKIHAVVQNHLAVFIGLGEAGAVIPFKEAGPFAVAVRPAKVFFPEAFNALLMHPVYVAALVAALDPANAQPARVKVDEIKTLGGSGARIGEKADPVFEAVLGIAFLHPHEAQIAAIHALGFAQVFQLFKPALLKPLSPFVAEAAVLPAGICIALTDKAQRGNPFAVGLDYSRQIHSSLLRQIK
jgi:hypothetical protein